MTCALGVVLIGRDCGAGGSPAPLQARRLHHKFRHRCISDSTKLLRVLLVAAMTATSAASTSAQLPPPSVVELPDGFAWQVIADGITGATSMAVAPDGRVFVCEQTGSLRLIKDGVLLAAPFAEFEVDSSWERGLLGVALHPEFERNGYVYVCYVAAQPHPHHRISRVTARGDRADPRSEKVLFRGDNQHKLGGS